MQEVTVNVLEISLGLGHSSMNFCAQDIDKCYPPVEIIAPGRGHPHGPSSDTTFCSVRSFKHFRVLLLRWEELLAAHPCSSVVAEWQPAAPDMGDEF
jgi:hypothetical protein